MQKKKIVILLCAMFCVATAWGQQQAQNSLYFFNRLSYNPAYTGSTGKLSAVAIHRIQWVGIDGAPQTTFLTVHSPITNSQLSLGADITHDKIGVTKTTSAYLNVSYYVQLDGRGDKLYFGLKGGFNLFDAALSELETTSDPLQKDIKNKVKGNFGAGIYLRGELYYVGLSALSLLENSVIDKTKTQEGVDINALKLKRHFYLVGGYVFDISESFKLKPSALVKAVAGSPVEIDGEVAGLLYDKFWLGAGFRPGESFRMFLAVNVTPQLQIGYNYDYLFNELGKYSGGTHEFMLSYDFEFTETKFKSPRYF